MSEAWKYAAGAALGVAVWELFWWVRRDDKRRSIYHEAVADARMHHKPLIVVGAPDRGMTQGPGCGDITVDLGHSDCPVFYQADICKSLPFPDNSAVIYVSCVLEYVDDVDAAMAELRRVAGPHLHVVRVEPWTLTAYMYPGAKRTIPELK